MNSDAGCVVQVVAGMLSLVVQLSAQNMESISLSGEYQLPLIGMCEHDGLVSHQRHGGHSIVLRTFCRV